LPQAIHGSCRTKARCCPRRCKLGLGLPRAMVLGMREVGIGLRNCQRVRVRGKVRWAGFSWARQGTSFEMFWCNVARRVLERLLALRLTIDHSRSLIRVQHLDASVTT
jgi:hypothetical protein